MLEILKLLAVADIGGAEDAPSDTLVESTGIEPAVDTAVVDTPAPPSEIEIDGEKYAIDDVKTWKQSSMASKDYLEKVNSLKLEQEKNKEALELFQYMQSKPELVKKLYEFDAQAPKVNSADPVSSEVRNLSLELSKMRIEKDIEILKMKDKDADEMAILKTAVDNNLDVNTAYKLWRAENFDSILNKKLKEQSKSITQELAKNKEITKTLVKNGDGIAASASEDLSDVEKMAAKKLGMDEAEYSKWKNYKR